MVRQDESIEFCHAHSGVLQQIKIGGAIIGGLMVIFGTILGVMWSDQKNTSKEILSKLNCVASSSDFEAVRTRVDNIYYEQQRLKWEIEVEKAKRSKP